MTLTFDILYESEYEDEVFQKEEEFIELMNTKIDGYNLASGGKFNKGYKQSEYAKGVASEVHSQKTGSKNAFYGKKHSDESKRKMSESLKGRKGRPLSDKQRQILLDNNPRIKRVSCYGVEYQSLTKAAEAIGIDRKKISRMANDPNNNDFYIVEKFE